MFGPNDTDALLRIRPGDEVEVDNSGFLATPDLSPPPGARQRPVPGLGPVPPRRRRAATRSDRSFWARSTAHGRHRPDGALEGKMIVVASLLDREALPWQADWYRARVHQHLGDATNEHFRLWFTANTLHGSIALQEDGTHVVSYLGVLHQALRDLSRWVKAGVEPPETTRYEVVDGQVVVPPDAASRRGVQPVVRLTVDGGERADVDLGDAVTLRAVADVPPGTGCVVAVEWDLDGTGAYAQRDPIEPAPTVVVDRPHVFSERGTHFVAVRVVSNRAADAATPYARLQNLARVRVVVS